MARLADGPVLRVAAIVGLLIVGACASAKTEAVTPVSELPVYTQSEKTVFDDSIAPEVFGLEVEGSAYEEEPQFVERAQFADHIFRAKIKTVSAHRLGAQQRYRIVLEPIGKPIVGRRLPADVELLVGRASPSINLLRTMASGIVGSTSVVFMREYRLEDQRVFHFRGEPDSEQVIAAVREARTRPTPSAEDGSEK